MFWGPKPNFWGPPPGDGGGDGGDGDGGRIFQQHQPPPHHAQGYHIPFGSPLTPIYIYIYIYIYDIPGISRKE